MKKLHYGAFSLYNELIDYYVFSNDFTNNMEENKIKVLVVPSDRQGVGHFRSIWMAQQLRKSHKQELQIKIDVTPDFNNINYLSSFDIIHFHRQLGPFEASEKLFSELQSKGTILVMDIDDFWSPPPTHPLYELVMKEGIDKHIENNLKLVDWVTTTTEIFADKIREVNKNVFVIPNAVNPKSKMWRSETIPNPTDRTRVAWIGGSSHLHDLFLLRDSMSLLSKDQALKDKTQIVMCGFDIRGNLTNIDEHGNKHERPIQPHETVWMQFERIFTSDYQLLKDDHEYFKWLYRIKNDDYPQMTEKAYVRRWTLPLKTYATHYDHCDVCLAPLTDHYTKQIGKGNKAKIIKRPHIFNKVKSELKVIEAGVKRKALIAQDFGVYSQTIKDGETGILVKNNKKGWYNAIKKVVDDPRYRQELADNLHDWVMEEYSIERINGLRADFYKEVFVEMKQKNKIVV